MNIEGNTSLALMQAAQANGADALNSAKQTATDKDAKRINEVAQDFEAMFMTEMLKPMFAEIKPDERFGGGKGEEVFSGMMLQEYGKMMAETGSLGIADSVKAQLIEMQDEANGKRPNLETNINLEANTQQDNTNNNQSPLNDIIEELSNGQ